MRFLRYNSRHQLWFPRGYKGWVWPRLNPIESCSHGANHKPTWKLWEPGWCYRLRRKWFCYAGENLCSGNLGHWHLGPDGFRTCSLCGSLHFADFIEICRRAIKDKRYGVEGSTKSYKIYVSQPGVRNASEGAIKYYTNHSPRNVSEADMEIYREALRVSNERFQAMMAMRGK